MTSQQESDPTKLKVHFAYAANGGLVWPYAVTPDNKHVLQPFACPYGSHKLQHRVASNRNQAHFAHMPTSSGSRTDMMCAGETDAHQTSKLWIADHITQIVFRRQCLKCRTERREQYPVGTTAQVEKRSADRKTQPDVTVYNDVKTPIAVVEVVQTHWLTPASRMAENLQYGPEHLHEVRAETVMKVIGLMTERTSGAIVIDECTITPCTPCREAEMKRQEQERKQREIEACMRDFEADESRADIKQAHRPAVEIVDARAPTPLSMAETVRLWEEKERKKRTDKEGDARMAPERRRRGHWRRTRTCQQCGERGWCIRMRRMSDAKLEHRCGRGAARQRSNYYHRKCLARCPSCNVSVPTSHIHKYRKCLQCNLTHPCPKCGGRTSLQTLEQAGRCSSCQRKRQRVA